MPNWCCTNYAIRGSHEDLGALVKTLNTMENSPNGFGRYWMGNLLIAFGMPMETIERGEIRCRGTFDPNPYAVAQLCGPDCDENDEFYIDDDGILRMSAIHAWYRSEDMEEFLKEKFPSLEFYFYATDEFGNFHEIHDPEDLGGFYPYALYFDYEHHDYRQCELNKFINDFKKACPGLEIPGTLKELSSPEFEQRFCDWKNEDESRECIEYYYVAEFL